MAERLDDQQRADKPRYPCHVCAGTMLPGVTYTFPSHYDPTVPSSGKVMYNPTMAACAAGYNSMAQKIVDCFVCKGTGWVSERRRPTERRKIADRRCARSAGTESMDAQELHAAHALANFQAILRYTEGFYAAAIEHGMKAGETANKVAHMENAARALYKLATSTPRSASERRAIVEECAKVCEQFMPRPEAAHLSLQRNTLENVARAIRSIANAKPCR